MRSPAKNAGSRLPCPPHASHSHSSIRFKVFLSKSVRIFCGMTRFSSLPPCLATLPCSSPPHHPFSPPSLWWHRLAGWHTPTPYLHSKSLLCFQGQSTKEYLFPQSTRRDGAATSLLLTTVKDSSSGRINGHWKSSRQKACEELSSPPLLHRREMKNGFCSSSQVSKRPLGWNPTFRSCHPGSF